jgi:hypothetical protein
MQQAARAGLAHGQVPMTLAPIQSPQSSPRMELMSIETMKHVYIDVNKKKLPGLACCCEKSAKLASNADNEKGMLKVMRTNNKMTNQTCSIRSSSYRLWLF